LSRIELLKAPVSHSKDPDLQKVPQALMRAAEKARQLAEQTGTQRQRRRASKAQQLSENDDMGRSLRSPLKTRCFPPLVLGAALERLRHDHPALQL